MSATQCTARQNGEECDWFEQGAYARRMGRPALENPFIGEKMGARQCWDDGWLAEDTALRTGKLFSEQEGAS